MVAAADDRSATTAKVVQMNKKSIRCRGHITNRNRWLFQNNCIRLLLLLHHRVVRRLIFSVILLCRLSLFLYWCKLRPALFETPGRTVARYFPRPYNIVVFSRLLRCSFMENVLRYENIYSQTIPGKLHGYFLWGILRQYPPHSPPRLMTIVEHCQR